MAVAVIAVMPMIVAVTMIAVMTVTMIVVVAMTMTITVIIVVMTLAARQVGQLDTFRAALGSFRNDLAVIVVIIAFGGGHRQLGILWKNCLLGERCRTKAGQACNQSEPRISNSGGHLLLPYATHTSEQRRGSTAGINKTLMRQMLHCKIIDRFKEEPDAAA